MDGERRRERLRSFLIGGVLGGAAGLVAAGRVQVRKPPPRHATPAGLAAFEQAPCYEDLIERESGDRPPG